MKAWEIADLDIKAHKPEILASGEDARVIAIDLPAGECLDDHQVHERAWLVVISGEVEVTPLEDAADQPISGGAGLLVEFAPSERHRVDARSDSRFLLFLTPWPGSGHPGAMTIEDKSQVRDRAAAKRPDQPG